MPRARSRVARTTNPGSRVTSSAFARPGILARAAVAFALAALVGSCSSNVSGPTNVDDPARVTIQPDTAVLYSGMATTFTVSGGAGTYSISSSNQAVVQVPTFLNGRTFTVTPANVLADTAVTISVRDSSTAPVATAALTVRPGTVANDIQVIPSSTQGSNCAPAVCSGGDAIVFATVSQGGNPLPARGVRLDVVTGDFRFIVSAPGQPEVLATSTTVVSDQAGGVHARIRVLPGVANQTGIVQVTDLGTNAFRRTAFTIAQATGSSPGFFAIPDTITFTGPNNLSCASGARQDVSIFGGSPPYTIGNAGNAFGLSQNVVLQSGGSFYIVANGACAENIPIPIVDSAGRTTTVTVSNVRGTEAVPPLVVSPTTVSLSDCQAAATVSVTGGIPNSFTVSSGSPGITVSQNPSTGVIGISRTANSSVTSPVSVGVASGGQVATVTVNVSGDALNTRCDGTNLRVTPAQVTLNSCGGVTVAVTGGSPPYRARSDNSSVSLGVCSVAPPNDCLIGSSGGTTSIFRTPTSASFTSGTVTITDNAGSIRVVPVTGAGTGPGSGTGPC